MFGSAIFEAVIGTVVIYILLSLFCIVLNEWISRLFNLRSQILEKEIHNLLGPTLAAALLKQPLIRNTFDSGRFPNYIPTSTFALALLELGYDYTPGVHGNPGATKVKKRWTGNELLLLDALRLSATSLGPIQARIEKWFDLAMEHAAGNFKRIVNVVVLGIAALIIGFANANTIAIASGLYNRALDHKATQFTLFWPNNPDIVGAIPGLLLTLAAVSLGAPFWFDMLGKLVNLRQTGLPPDENKRQQTNNPG